MKTIRVEPLDVNSYERNAVFQMLVARVRGCACEVLGSLLEQAMDDEVTHYLQRPSRSPRQESRDALVPWPCHRCGGTMAGDFLRNGHYQRDLQTTHGAVVGLRMPMVRCVLCGAAADVEFAGVPKQKHFWLDVDEDVVFAYGANEGLRHIGQRVGKQLGWPVSASAIQARVHRMELALSDWQQRPIADPPDVLMLDGIWFTFMEATGEYQRDAAGRRRAVQRRVKRVAIIALGLWSDSGRKEILDFEIADSEDEDNCLALLNRLHLRGVTEAHVELIVSDGAGGICAAIETAYPTVARQRCVFHKLKNISDNLRDKSHRKEILEAASWIYDAENPRQAHNRLEQFVATWEDREPDAVHSLQTDFEASVAYLGPLRVKHARRYRTTNALEGGVMRPLRTKLDQVTAFRSPAGAKAGFLLTILRLNAHQRDDPWVYETKDIVTMLYNQNP